MRGGVDCAWGFKVTVYLHDGTTEEFHALAWSVEGDFLVLCGGAFQGLDPIRYEETIVLGMAGIRRFKIVNARPQPETKGGGE